MGFSGMGFQSWTEGGIKKKVIEIKAGRGTQYCLLCDRSVSVEAKYI